MAGTDRTLRINDGFSSVLDRYTAKVEQAIATEDRWAGATDRAIADQQRWGAALDMAQYKTLTYRDSIENMQEALKIFAKEGASLTDVNAATDSLSASIERAGYSFTDAAKGLDRFNLLTQNSIPKLVKSGILVDNMAEANKRAAEAAEEFAEAEDKAVGAPMHKKMNFFTKRLIRMGLIFVSARRLLRYTINAIQRAPDEIGEKFNALKDGLSTGFARVLVAAMGAMTDGVQRLLDATGSPGFQHFLRILEAIARVAGQVLGGALAIIGDIFEVTGNNLMLFADKTARAFNYIGGVVQTALAVVHNVIADTYNNIMSLAELIINFFKDPWSAIANYVYQTGSHVLGILRRVASGIDAVFGTKLESRVNGLIDNLNAWADSGNFSENAIKLFRMEHIEYKDAWEAGFNKELYSDVPQQVKAIAKNTSAIADALTNEDLTAIVNAAERSFVNKVNLTSQTPIITINGANTGNTEADRLALSRAISNILVNQLASGTIASQAVYGGV